ncbi:FAD-dependent oxidoreductase [Campylobacterota bacterium DY0563]
MIDVLIIGSGGAGLSAALEAKKNNSNVLVVSKTYPTHSQTCQAQGGINAVLETTENDSVDNYINDTYKASHKLANKSHIEYLCSESKNTIDWLTSIGVPFSKDIKNNIAQRKFGGTKAKRTCYSSDYTGLKILHTLYDQCIKEEIKFLNEYFLLKLIVEENSIKAALFLDMVKGEVVEIKAKAIILATGGYAGIYHQSTTNSFASTGDGIAAAFKAGALLSNMEFVQFHPTSLESKNILVSESARGEGGYLVDKDGNRFIDELKPRDEVARAIFERTHKHENVYLDLRHLGKEKIEEVMPQERRLILDFMKLKMEEDLIPINPSAHYTMGGILTNDKTQTSIKNLYACGECAQSGIHGANRLGGNSLLEIVTLGRLSGKIAAKNAKEIEYKYQSDNVHCESERKRLEDILNRENKKDLYKTKKELGKLLFNNLGLFREEKRVKKVLDYLEELENQIPTIGIEDKSKVYNRNLIDYLEYENMYLLSKTIAKSAYERKESRGAHYRIDFKEENNTYEKISISKLENNNLKFCFEDLK